MTDQTGEGPRMITFEEAAARGDFIQLERREPADEDDPLAGFNPDDALEKIRELCHADDLEATGNPLAVLIAALDDHLCGGCGALPQDWQPDPGVIAERFFRNQPRRTSREERRR